VAPWLNNWSSPDGRSLVLGDAAHAMIPTGGLGASLAFEDAECLAVAIDHMRPFNSTQKRIEILHTWEAHRKVRLNLVQEFTNRNKRLRSPAGSWLGQTFKEWFVWAFIKVLGPGGAAQDIYKYDSRTFKEML
jgi:2-polyprenyl-6-methoxyphenol hydroxylase-like FAD-dependent oxidoreductase